MVKWRPPVVNIAYLMCPRQKRQHSHSRIRTLCLLPLFHLINVLSLSPEIQRWPETPPLHTMGEDFDPTNPADALDNDNGGDFSKLEAGFAELKIDRRRISIEVQDVWRHAQESDLIANDLDFNYSSNAESLPPNPYPSMQDILPALQYSSHLAVQNNFADETDIECFDQTDAHVAFLSLDSMGLDKVLDTVKKGDRGICDTASTKARLTSTTERRFSATGNPHTLPSSTEQPSSTTTPCTLNPETTHSTTDSTFATVETSTVTEPTASSRLLVFFVPLMPKKDSSFGSQLSMQRSSVQKIFEVLGVNPEFLLNMLGRPDYWSPRTRWQCNIRDELTMCGMEQQ